MKPFSPLKFFLENKKRAAVIVSILMLSVAVISFVTALVESIIVDAINANLKPYENCAIVTRTPSAIFLKDSVVEKVTSLPQVAKSFSATVENTYYQALMGNTSAPVFFFTGENDVQEVMTLNYMELVAGRLPSDSTYEIILHESLLRNKGLSIGDFIGSEAQTDEWLQGKYKIVGSLKGEAMIGFGRISYTTQAIKDAGLTMDKPLALYLIAKPGQLDALNAELDSIDTNEASVVTYSYIEELIETQIASISTILKIVIFVTVLALSLSVGGLAYIIYAGRADEFGILFAMGKSKGFINRLIIKELAALMVFCWAAGYLFSLAITYTTNALLLTPKGQTLYFFIPAVLTNTLLVPLMVFICTVAPILRKFRKWDPIAIIERRD